MEHKSTDQEFFTSAGQEAQPTSASQGKIPDHPSDNHHDLDTAAMAALFRGPVQAEKETDARGLQLGPWRLVEKLGQGGMGAVWLGERCDSEFQMRVAVKLIKNPLASPQSVERFKRERQFLADLSHPNIAVLHDGGTTPRGLPYLVMEYVIGETIDRWCAREQPSLTELSAIFAQVCSAVSHAHQHGILHRDIKPHNIMVTAHNQPKLLDFGIAVQDQQSGLTTTGLSPMTLAYAAPERLRGSPATPAADIYSLGFVLLELITGKTPAELAGLSEQGLHQLPEMVHLKADHPALFHGLAGALENDPTKRPESVERFRHSLLSYRAGSDLALATTLQNDITEVTSFTSAPTHVPEEQSPELIAECLVPAGPFLMGSIGDAKTPRCETPQHEVHLPAFYMSRYPVTNGQFAVYLEVNKDKAAKNAWLLNGPSPDRLQHPVTTVSWFDATAYCRWLSEIKDERYRLPSEAEWEKAAGGLDGKPYPWGPQWEPSQCFLGKTTHAVSRRQAGPFGCCQMVGHIQEWTSTRWGSDPLTSDYPYPYRPDDGRETQTAAFHLHRGGAYRDPPERIGCRTRGWSNPNGTFIWRGFRILREA